jgi:hypothetical protein
VLLRVNRGTELNELCDEVWEAVGLGVSSELVVSLGAARGVEVVVGPVTLPEAVKVANLRVVDDVVSDFVEGDVVGVTFSRDVAEVALLPGERTPFGFAGEGVAVESLDSFDAGLEISEVVCELCVLEPVEVWLLMVSDDVSEELVVVRELSTELSVVESTVEDGDESKRVELEDEDDEVDVRVGVDVVPSTGMIVTPSGIPVEEEV